VGEFLDVVAVDLAGLDALPPKNLLAQCWRTPLKWYLPSDVG